MLPLAPLPPTPSTTIPTPPPLPLGAIPSTAEQIAPTISLPLAATTAAASAATESASTIEAMLATAQGGDPPNIPFELLQEWTDEFSERNKIGHGSFGEVFKGVYRLQPQLDGDGEMGEGVSTGATVTSERACREK